MRALYLIFSHEHQPQVARLALAIRRLSPDAEIAIHHDPQHGPFDPALLHPECRARLVPHPIRAQWGDFSQVEQYLHAFRWSVASLEFDWVITLTGLSYPIHPLQAFEAMLAASSQDCFVYHFDAYDINHWPEGTAKTRFHFRYFAMPKFKYWHHVPFMLRSTLESYRAWLNKSQALIRIVPRPRGLNTLVGFRRLPPSYANRLKLQGGRQFLNLSKQTLCYVLQFVDDNPGWGKYLQTCLNPDETFFTTILANTAHLRITNDVMRFIRWPREKCHAASGAVILSNEIPEVLSSPAPFALKLDSRVDEQALDLLDKHLGLQVISANSASQGFETLGSAPEDATP